MQHKVIDVEDVVIRFAGDSGDGMQLTGSLFANMSAIYGNELSTFPDFPAEIRAPHGTVSGVSGFQVHFGSGRITTPGDYCDMLVAMNPAALKSNAKWLKRTAMVLIDEDTFDEEGIRKAGFLTMDPITELKIEDRVIIVAPITALTAESLKDSGLDMKTVHKCKNMFTLGMASYIYNRPVEHIYDYLQKKFGKKHPELIAPNRKVLDDGYNYASNIQAIANTTEDLLPNDAHKTISRDYEYRRLGTISLLAGIDLQTGEAIPLVRDRHSSKEYIEFLQLLDSKYPKEDKIRLILDNLQVHTSKETKKYLASVPGRFEFVFTPKHGSWLNLVEGFFSKLTRQSLKGIRVKTKNELVERIYKYFEEINDIPVVYHWKYRLDEIDPNEKPQVETLPLKSRVN